MSLLNRALASAVFVLSLPLFSMALPVAANAHDVQVHEAWARASAGQAANGGAFMKIENTSPHEERLLSAAADVAKTVELHTHIKEGNVMKMRRVESIAVPMYGAVELMPGGLHVMLIGLKAPLKEGDTFPLTLTFEHAGKITVPVTVQGVGAMGGAKMDHGSMNHGSMDHGSMGHGTMEHGAMKH